MNEKPIKKKIFHNGSIIILNDSQSTVEAVCIEGERIIEVGFLEDIQAKIKNNYDLVDLKGRTLLPDFIDCHMHAIGALFFLLYPDFSKIRSLEELKEYLKIIIKDKEPNKLILVFNLDEERFEKPIFPTRWDLDQVSPNHPVFIFCHNVHLGVVNSKALLIKMAVGLWVYKFLIIFLFFLCQASLYCFNYRIFKTASRYA